MSGFEPIVYARDVVEYVEQIDQWTQASLMSVYLHVDFFQLTDSVMMIIGERVNCVTLLLMLLDRLYGEMMRLNSQSGLTAEFLQVAV